MLFRLIIFVKHIREFNASFFGAMTDFYGVAITKVTIELGFIKRGQIYIGYIWKDT